MSAALCRQSVSLLVILLGLILGCGGDDEQPAPPAAPKDYGPATTLMQEGRFEEAVNEIGDDEEPQALYLKAVALLAMKQPEVARTLADRALAGNPEEVRYQALAKRMRLKPGDVQSYDDVIDIYDKHPTNAVAAFYAYYAFEAKRLLAIDKKDLAQAKAMHQKGLDALTISAALADSAPELKREMLGQVLQHRLAKESQALSGDLRKIAPDDPWVQTEQVNAALVGGQEEIAAVEARKIYEGQGKTEQTALIYATAMVKAPSSLDRDKEFADLEKRFPNNQEITLMHALYHARADRVVMALSILDKAIVRLQSGPQRSRLIHAAMGIALETETDLAENLMGRYRKEIKDPLMMKYIEARILHRQNKQEEALKLLDEVVKSQKGNPNQNPALARQALHWMQIILQERLILLKMEENKKAQEETAPAPVEAPKPAPESAAPREE